MNMSPLGLLGISLMQEGSGNDQNGIASLLPLLMKMRNGQGGNAQGVLPTPTFNGDATNPNPPQSSLTSNPDNYMMMQQARGPQQQNPANTPPLQPANMYPPQVNGLLNNTRQSMLNTNLPSFAQTSPQAAMPEDKSQMLAQLRANAASAYPNNPTMQQVAMTQAIEESNLMGKPSQLAAQNNNYFGIKAPGTDGVVRMPTTEYVNGQAQTQNASFGRNQSPEDSFMQHRNLMSNRRYAPVMNANNPSQAFQALQSAGYATDPQYANKLNRIYNNYVAPLYSS